MKTFPKSLSSRLQHGLLSSVAAALFSVPLAALPSAEVLSRDGEVVYQGWEQLGQWEVNDLRKAESVFSKAREANRSRDQKAKRKAGNLFKQAVALYDQFILAHQQSPALAYAMMRQGRAFQLYGQRSKALNVYQEVIDFFPDEVAYAAPSRFYRGQTYLQNGDTQKALAEFILMVQDEEYRKHLLAANALNALSAELEKAGEATKALKYLRQLANDFRHTNAQQAKLAIGRAVKIMVRRQQAADLQEFFIEVGGFGDPNKIKKIPKNAEQIPDFQPYWQQVVGVLQGVSREGFGEGQEAKAQQWHRYWADQIGSHVPDDDNLHKVKADLYRGAGEKRADWVRRLDEQYASRSKGTSNQRTVVFIKWFISANLPQKVQEYYQKLDRNKLSFGTLMELLKGLASFDRDVALSTISGYPVAKLSDGELDQLAAFMARSLQAYDRVEPLLVEYDDRPRGVFALLKAMAGNKAVPVDVVVRYADELQGQPRYAQEASMIKGQALKGSGDYQAAIVAFQQANMPPRSAYEIAECLLLDGNLAASIEELASIEALFKDDASRAALRQADYYKRGKSQAQEIEVLKRVMRTYKGSREAAAAHVRLEQYGIMIESAVVR